MPFFPIVVGLFHRAANCPFKTKWPPEWPPEENNEQIKNAETLCCIEFQRLLVVVWAGIEPPKLVSSFFC